MGNVIVQGHDPNSNTEKQITTTREEFKEIPHDAPAQKQIWSEDVHLRNIEKLGESAPIVYTPNGGGSQTFNYDVSPIEHFSSILFKVWKLNVTTGVYELSDDFDGKIAVNVDIIEHDTQTGTTYPSCVTSNGCGVKKISPDWVDEAGITVIASGSEDGTYVFQVYAERSYDVDTSLGNIDVHVAVTTEAAEKTPLNVQPLEELVYEDVETIDEISAADAQKLFDKDRLTYATLNPGLDWIFGLKKSFRIGLLKIFGAGLALDDSGVEITLTKPNGDELEFITEGEPIEVYDEITQIQMHNPLESAVKVYEIIAELYLERRVHAPESRPLTVHPEQYITSEMIKGITITDTQQNETEMSRADINRLFDKNCDTQVSLPDGYMWTLRFKMSMMLKEFLLTDGVNHSISLGYAWTSVHEVRTPTNGYTYARYITIDDQVSSIEIYNGQT